MMVSSWSSLGVLALGVGLVLACCLAIALGGHRLAPGRNTTPRSTPQHSIARRGAAGGVLLLAVLGVYLLVGNPFYQQARQANLESELLGRAPLLSREDMQSAATLNADERNAMIRAMVDSLQQKLEAAPAHDPANFEGWVRLSRARLVLGEPQRAIEAARRAVELAPADSPLYTSALIFLARALREVDQGHAHSESAQLVEAVLDINPTHLEALWFSAVALADEGRVDEAANRFQTFFAEAQKSELPLDSSLVLLAEKMLKEQRIEADLPEPVAPAGSVAEPR